MAAMLREAGATPEHMVRMTWYIVDRVEYHARLAELGAVYREVMGRNFPAMTCVEVAALMEQRARIESRSRPWSRTSPDAAPRYLTTPVTSMVTRRSACRHWMSAARGCASAQFWVTGSRSPRLAR